MERYVTGGAVGVYEKGGPEEMEPGEAPAVSVLILIWGPESDNTRKFMKR